MCSTYISFVAVRKIRAVRVDRVLEVEVGRSRSVGYTRNQEPPVGHARARRRRWINGQMNACDAWGVRSRETTTRRVRGSIHRGIGFCFGIFQSITSPGRRRTGTHTHTSEDEDARANESRSRISRFDSRLFGKLDYSAHHAWRCAFDDDARYVVSMRENYDASS